ncbi:hypothetical protein ACIOD2_46675 [Amycolatopsis sp. NPDC088138]|uniref:NucA/NucB deoxyribonuclease domain-containing protein n=1 Tax=Amycolatopsis sp. NPDC088138 TaxID=3363938 RepID=UPI00382FA5BA
MRKRTLKLAGVLTLAATLLISPQTVSADTGAQTTAQPAAASYTYESRIDDADLPTDPVTFDECDHQHTSNETFWYKNRYNICQSRALDVVNYALRNGVLVKVGTVHFGYTFIGVATDKASEIKFSMRVKYLGTDGELVPEYTLTFLFDCVNADEERVSTCDYVHAPIVKPIGMWAAPGGDTPFSWTATAATTSVPPDDATHRYHDEYRGSFLFGVTSIVSGGGVTTPNPLGPEKFRCDSATYANRGSRCVFTGVVPTMLFDLNNEEYKESSLFIKAAQELQPDIININPQLKGKKVPGRFNESKLSYLYSGYDTGNSKKGSRSKIRRVCKASVTTGPYTKDENGNPRQCDEYPFASTYQNAAKVKEASGWSFAAKPIAADHNGKGGNMMASWYGREHMLDGDEFYVVVR